MQRRTRRLRPPYPSTSSDEEWAFVAPYLTLRHEEARQRQYPSCDVYNVLHWMVRAGAPWRMMPTDFSPWEILAADHALGRGRMLRGARA